MTRTSIQPTDTTPPVVYQFTADELRQRLSALPKGFDEAVKKIAAGDADPAWILERATELLATGKARELVREAIAIRRNLRVDIESERKGLKSGALEYGRRVGSVAKGLIGIVLETETPLKTLKQAYDDEKARIKQEQEEAERIAREEELRLQREAEEARLRAEREAEERRLAEERAKFEAERKAAEEEARKERERLAAERRAAEIELQRAREKAEAEEARQRAEQEKREAEARAERERLAAERRAFEEEQSRIRAEQEAKDRAERERIETEEAAVREQERQAALARRLEAVRPDRDRAVAYVDALLAVEVPDVHDKGIHSDLDRLIAALEMFRADFSKFGEEAEAAAE